jgi:hypothetical protein
MRNLIDIITEATIANYPAGSTFTISGSQNGQSLTAVLAPQGVDVDGTMTSMAPEEADLSQVQAKFGEYKEGRPYQLFHDDAGTVWAYFGGSSTMNSSFNHASNIANRGDIAEGILGAAMFAKFTKREGNEDIGMITVSDIYSVLDKLEPVGPDDYQVEVRDSDSRHADIVTYRLALQKKPYQDLLNPDNRDALKNEFSSAAAYVNSSMAERYSRYFYLNGRRDHIAVIADGAIQQRSSKVDVWVAVRDRNGNTRKLRLNASLKNGPIKQFGQVGGSSMEAMVKLWDEFGVDVTKYAKEFERAHGQGQEHAIELMYRKVADQLATKLKRAGPNSEAEFVDKIAHAVTYFATLGDENVELVQFDKGGFKILRFNTLARKLRDIDITATYIESKARPEIIIHDVHNTKNVLITVRSKFETVNGELYVRNYIEKGSLLDELTRVERADWKEIESQADSKIADIAAGKSTSGLRPKAAEKAREKRGVSTTPRQRR